MTDYTKYDARTDEGYAAIIETLAKTKQSIGNGNFYLPFFYNIFDGGNILDTLDALYLKATEIHNQAVKEREEAKKAEEEVKQTEKQIINKEHNEQEDNVIKFDLTDLLNMFNNLFNNISNNVKCDCGCDKNECKCKNVDNNVTKKETLKQIIDEEDDKLEEESLIRLATEYLNELVADTDVTVSQYNKSRDALVAYSKWVLARNK